MIRTIISDMGNVILTFDHMIFIRKAADFSPHSPKKILIILENHIDLIQDFSRGKLEPEAYVKQMSRLIDADIEPQEFITMYRDIFSLNRKVLDTLCEYRDSKKMVLLSNTDTIHFEYIQTTFPEMFIFDEYILSFETGSLKPELDIYKTALERAGVSAEEAVFIDDLEPNVKAAVSLGMKGIIYRNETNLGKELTPLLTLP